MRKGKHGISRAEYIARAHEFAPRGDRLPHTKLTPTDVSLIRELHQWRKDEIERINSIASLDALGRKFGVSARAISAVVSRQNHSI